MSSLVFLEEAKDAEREGRKDGGGNDLGREGARKGVRQRGSERERVGARERRASERKISMCLTTIGSASAPPPPPVQPRRQVV